MLRKTIYSYILSKSGENLQLTDLMDPINEKFLEIKRTARFFPQKNKSYQPKNTSKVSKYFIDKIIKSVLKEETDLLEEMNDKNSTETLTLLEFIDKLEELFLSHKVSHIFRGNILHWSKRQGFNINTVTKWLQLI